jgi:hypothetical protein
MQLKDILQKLEGVQTVETVMNLLGANRTSAVYYIHKLRKAGYVKTLRSPNGARVYKISYQNKFNGISYYDIINEASPIQILAPMVYKVYGKKPTPEETLIFAIKTQSVRTILASLALFRRIDNWIELYHLAKENRVERQVGALYDIARKNIAKVRRMPKKFRNLAIPKQEYEFKFVVPGMKSKEFPDVENTWRIYLPFNRTDFEEYK